MRPSREQNDNVISMRGYLEAKSGVENIDSHREKAPKRLISRRQAIGATVLAALMPVGAFLGAQEEKGRQELFDQKAAELQAERESMTPQEAAEHGRQEAARQVEQQVAYEANQNSTELSSGVSTEQNGSETVVNAPIEISAKRTPNVDVQNPESPLGEETGRITGEEFNNNG